VEDLVVTRRPAAFVGATVIDATGAPPRENAAIVVDDGRISWVGPVADLGASTELERVDAVGKDVIPGLMDANVHLVSHSFDPEFLLRYEPGCYDELVVEAAQVALKVGLTTVFDTWGPLEALRRVRDRVNAGEVTAARIFCAGNIIGNDGPWADDNAGRMYARLNPAVVARVNQHWEQGVGGDLPWRTPEGVREAVREYVETSGIDFVKYAGSVHKDIKFLTFSPDAQRAIVEEAHGAGLTAQACTITPEALKIAIQAGVDLLQHGNITGRYPMPQETVDLIADRQLPCCAFLTTQRFMEAVRADPQGFGSIMIAKEQNDRNLIAAGAKLLLADDACVWGPTAKTSPAWGMYLGVPDHYMDLGHSHLRWFRAASELGMDPMAALQAATRNIAEAYGKLDEIGTLEPGKAADFLVLDANPLEDPENYGRIADVVKDGKIVDRDALPENPVLLREAVLEA
jgi:imidazolonepropionase-like amidohydrolase